MSAVRIPWLAIAAALAVTSPAARAAEQEGGAGTVYPKAQYPYGELVRQPLTLAQGLIEVDVPVEVNLTQGHVAKPWNIPAAIDFGYTDDLQLGIFHEVGFCFASKSDGCPQGAYDDLGGRVRYGVHRGPDGQLALEASILAASFDRGRWDGGVGVAYKRTLGRFAFVVGADLTVALNDREATLDDAEVRPWRERFEGRGELQLQLQPRFAAFGRIAYRKYLEESAASNVDHQLPVGLGAEFEPFARIGVGVELTLDLLGKDTTDADGKPIPGVAHERTGVVFARLFL